MSNIVTRKQKKVALLKTFQMASKSLNKSIYTKCSTCFDECFLKKKKKTSPF